MQQFLQIIKGKKTLIVGIIGVLTAYSIGKWWIGSEEAMAINGILGLLGFTASKYTK